MQLAAITFSGVSCALHTHEIWKNRSSTLGQCRDTWTQISAIFHMVTQSSSQSSPQTISEKITGVLKAQKVTDDARIFRTASVAACCFNVFVLGGLLTGSKIILITGLVMGPLADLLYRYCPQECKTSFKERISHYTWPQIQQRTSSGYSGEEAEKFVSERFLKYFRQTMVTASFLVPPFGAVVNRAITAL